MARQYHEVEEPALRTAVQAFLDISPSVPGCVAYVVRPDGTRAEAAVGWADRASRRPMTVDATFRVASSTKTFTAATVLRLAEHGTVAVDEPVGRFFDRATVERLGLSGITLLHLLQHTSGLRDMDGDEFMQILYTQPDKQWTAWEKIERSIASGPPDGPPGPPARYCDVGYIVLAMAIEAVTGAPLHESFRQLLRFDELGLASIHVEALEPVPAAAGPRVRHYVESRDVTNIDPSCDLWGAGGLVADAHDLAEWWHALFAGRIFDQPATLDRMLTTTPEPSASRDMGLGIYRRTIGGHEIWAHGGWWGSYPLHDRTTGTTAAVLVSQCLDHVGPEHHPFAIGLVTVP